MLILLSNTIHVHVLESKPVVHYSHLVILYSTCMYSLWNAWQLLLLNWAASLREILYMYMYMYFDFKLSYVVCVCVCRRTGVMAMSNCALLPPSLNWRTDLRTSTIDSDQDKVRERKLWSCVCTVMCVGGAGLVARGCGLSWLSG